MRGPGRHRQQRGALRPFLRGDAPQLLGDERHERVQKLEDLVARPGGHRLRLRDCTRRPARQDGLGKLQVPVAVDVPDEPVGRLGRLVETEGVERLGDLAAGLLQFVRDPAVERLLGGGRIERRHGHAVVHLGKARRVPDLGREIAIALDALGRELDVAALRRHGGEREAQRVGAVLIDQAERIDDIALRLRHLGAALVAHQRVDVDGVTQKKMMSKPVTSTLVG